MNKIFVTFLILLAGVSCMFNRDREMSTDTSTNLDWTNIAFSDSLLTYALPEEGFDIFMLSKSADSMKLPYSSLVLYIFDGNCSGCIAEYIKWNIDWVSKLDNDSVLVCYIVQTTNKALLGYYLDESKLRLPVNHAILIDQDGVATKGLATRWSLDLSSKVILFSNKHRRIIFGDPFNSKSLFSLYEKLTSIK
jgi:hypothetical protein